MTNADAQEGKQPTTGSTRATLNNNIMKEQHPIPRLWELICVFAFVSFLFYFGQSIVSGLLSEIGTEMPALTPKLAASFGGGLAAAWFFYYFHQDIRQLKRANEALRARLEEKDTGTSQEQE